MPRKGNVPKRDVLPDPKFGDKVLAKLINVIMTDGKKSVAEAIVYGAQVVAVQGNFDDAFRVVKEMAAKHTVTLVNSLNPYRRQGQKTAVFEIAEELRRSLAAAR